MRIDRDYRFIVGVDEVGRGPLAGPVTVGAVALTRSELPTLRGVKDSKRLSERARARWAETFLERGIRFATASVGASIVDRIGITRACARATARALSALALPADKTFVVLDAGLSAPARFTQVSMVRADERVPAVAAASIVAKVRRDRFMVRQAAFFPAYGFARHKGYGTDAHKHAIKKHGLCDLHRRSFLR